MSILNRTMDAARTPRLWAVLLATGLMGCVFFESLGGEKPFAFSHKLHVEEQGLECAACHGASETSEEPGLPSPRQCALCHDDGDAEKPAERKVATLFEGKNYRAARFTALGEEVIFSHRSHAGRAQDCAACHAAVAENEVPGPELALTMDSCTSCHEKSEAPSDCATCHTAIRAERAPATHGAAWKKSHGPDVRAQREGTANRCDLCHTESSCTACHQTEQPDSHGPFWSRRGHGISAAMDRASCSTCHPASSCDSCHRETEPLSHNGGFGSPVNNHCIGCHEPLAEEGCATCHGATPSHAQPTPKPPGHLPSMNCRMCHGNGQPLPHFDNGGDCNACHL